MRIFLSYCHKDADSASRLYRELAERGIDCWFDREDLLPGQRWRETIESAIRNSSHFIALLSKHSVTKEGFVQRELKLALDYLTEMPPERIFLIPARLDECVPSHPALRDLHWVDLFPDYSSALKRIVRAVDGYDDTSKADCKFIDGNDSEPSMLPPLNPGLPRRMYLQLPIEELYSEIRAATEHVRLLYTWIYASKPLLDALTPPLQSGVRIEILMLDPESTFTSIRSSDLGFEDPEHGAIRARSSLRDLVSWVTDAGVSADNIEVRIYDAPPTLLMIDTGTRLVYSPLFRGALAVEGPYIEAEKEDQELYLRAQRHFQRCWEKARVVRVTAAGAH